MVYLCRLRQRFPLLRGKHSSCDRTDLPWSSSLAVPSNPPTPTCLQLRVFARKTHLLDTTSFRERLDLHVNNLGGPLMSCHAPHIRIGDLPVLFHTVAVCPRVVLFIAGLAVLSNMRRVLIGSLAMILVVVFVL